MYVVFDESSVKGIGSGGFGRIEHRVSKQRAGKCVTLHCRSFEDGPMAIYDVCNDPRIQYPEAAEKEGIASILSVPIMIGDEPIGAMRAYTADKWEFTLDNVNFVQALAQISGILIEMTRLHKGQNEYIDTIATMRESPEL